MSRVLRRALAVVLIGVVLGLAGNQISPRGIPLVTPPKKAPRSDEFVALEKAKELWTGGSAVFLDAREEDDYSAGHIPTAFNLPVMSFDSHFGEVASMLTPESLIVAYCDGTECELSHRLAETLRRQGYTNVHILFNGWTEWRKGGFPTETGGRK